MVAGQRWLLVYPSAKKLSDLRRRQSRGKPLAMSTKVATQWFNCGTAVALSCGGVNTGVPFAELPPKFSFAGEQFWGRAARAP